MHGVSKGTVIAAILFLIMTSNIGENSKKSTVRTFANNLRVIKNTRNAEVKQCKSPSGDLIVVKDTVKDQGVFSSNSIMLKVHMEKIINSNKIVMGMLLRTFNTRKNEPMLKIFNTCIKSKIEYCCIVCSPPPVEQTWIYELRT